VRVIPFRRGKLRQKNENRPTRSDRAGGSLALTPGVRRRKL